ncbi:MAG: ATP/GTP-binding protein [Oscillospiraceae bacterium]
MKLLRITAKNFKNCKDNFTVDFTAKARKSSEDKMYELQEIDSGLYTYNTVAFVGKNASGKTTAIELIDCCYSILGDFRLENKHYSYENVCLEIYFYHEGEIFKYTTLLKNDIINPKKAVFTDEHVFKKRYYKSRINSLFDDGFTEISGFTELPEDTSNIFFILKKKKNYAVYFDSMGEGTDTYSRLFSAIKNYSLPAEIFENILTIFDENVKELSVIDEYNYKLIYRDEQKIISDKELLWFLSSGTTKGILLYTMMILSLRDGFDLIIDEIENHFHKTLVENMISLFKEKSVNKHNATLIFTTHYCEVLDLFSRQDNIWISKSDGQVYLSNMHENYEVRTELLKSRQFYNNAFETAVDYNELMNLKRKLKK